ncbi:uncharacterized protein ACNS7B_012074 [Menidia menidia]
MPLVSCLYLLFASSLDPQKCSGINCSLADTTNTACQCLNLKVPQGNCSCDYFIDGLEKLHSIDKDDFIYNLIKRVESIKARNGTFCSQEMICQATISPGDFYEKLRRQTQMFMEKRQ